MREQKVEIQGQNLSSYSGGAVKGGNYDDDESDAKDDDV